MADQDIDFFDYVEVKRRPPLLNKNLYMSKDAENYEKQLSFDKRLAKLMQYDYQKEIILHRFEFEETLITANKKITGYRLSSR